MNFVCHRSIRALPTSLACDLFLDRAAAAQGEQEQGTRKPPREEHIDGMTAPLNKLIQAHPNHQMASDARLKLRTITSRDGSKS